MGKDIVRITTGPTTTERSEKPLVFQQPGVGTPTGPAPIPFWLGFGRFAATRADALEHLLSNRRKSEELLLLFLMALRRLKEAPLDPNAIAEFQRLVVWIEEVHGNLNVGYALSRAQVKAFEMQEIAEEGRQFLQIIPPDRPATDGEQSFYLNEYHRPWAAHKKRVDDAETQFSRMDGAVDNAMQATRASEQLGEGALRMVSYRMAAITSRAPRSY